VCILPIRVFWAEPGPEANEALRLYWALAYEIAADIIGRQALQKMRTGSAGNEEEPKEPRR